MYSVHALLLSFSVKFTRNLNCNEHTLVGLLTVAYEEHYITVQRMDERECSATQTNSKNSKIEPSESFIAETAVYKGREEKMKVGHMWIPSISNSVLQFPRWGIVADHTKYILL